MIAVSRNINTMESLVFKDLLSEHSGIDTFHSDYYILIFYNYIILVELAYSKYL